MTITKSCYILISLFGLINGFYFANEGEHLLIKTETNHSVLSERDPNEGLILHVANNVTTINKIFFKAIILKDDTKTYKPSKSLHVLMVDSKDSIITSQIHKIKAGKVEGVINFPRKTERGRYFLRVYTSKMFLRKQYNYVQKSICFTKNEISRFTDSAIVGIEGSSLIAGLENRVVVYDPNSHNDKSNWRIVNQKGDLISKIQKFSNRIGTTLFTPKADTKYFFQTGNGRRIILPTPKIEGYTLQVNNLDQNVTKVQINRSSENLNDSLFLIGIVGGKKVLKTEVEWEGNSTTININKSELPSSLLTLQLENSFEKVFAQRPVSVRKRKVRFIIDSINSPKSKKAILIKSGTPKDDEISLSVNKDLRAGRFQSHIDEVFKVNTLELTGNTHSLEDEFRQKRFLQDLNVQLEEFRTKDQWFSKNSTGSKSYPKNDQIEFLAYVYDFNNELLKNTEIQIFIKSKDDVNIIVVKSNSQGLIKVKDLDFSGKADISFRTKGRDTKSRLVKAVLVKEEEIFPINSLFSDKEDNLFKDERTKANDFLKDTVGLIELEETVVVDKKISNAKGIKSLYGIEIPGKRVKYQDPKRPKTLAQLLVEIPGVSVISQNDTGLKVDIPRTKDPILWVVDGYALPRDPEGKTYGYPINSINPILDILSHVDIERIDLLLGPEVAIFGTRASGGVLSIKTRSGSAFDYVDRKKAQIEIQGYHVDEDFESYFKMLSKKEKNQSSLLYWNPSLTLNEKGEYKFYLSREFFEDGSFLVRYQ